MWDLETGECRQTLEGHSEAVNSVGITSDGHTAISGSNDKTVRYGVRCVVWLRLGYNVMWRLRAVGVCFVFVAFVLYWCTRFTDFGMCVICRRVFVWCGVVGCCVLLSGHTRVGRMLESVS